MACDAEFTFVDLFAGVGGFHAALHGLGGRCVQAVEHNAAARAIYEKAWLSPLPTAQQFRFVRDVNEVAPIVAGGTGSGEVDVEDHDVLTAGFPCQAFSKSGRQLGVMDEVRGTLFYNVLRIVAAKRPKVVLLENVRNLVGPRHRSTTYVTIIKALREYGYVVHEEPMIVSPHRIAPDHGGTPQVRERVFIIAMRDDLIDEAKVSDAPPASSPDWSPDRWRIDQTPLPILGGVSAIDPVVGEDVQALYGLHSRSPELEWIEAYESLLRAVMSRGGMSAGDGVRRLPGFPLWFGHQLDPHRMTREWNDALAQGVMWKVDFLKKNHEFHEANARVVAMLRERIDDFPESRKKLEWQAGDASSLWECLIQFRPSGIRVRPPTYAPALVAINQAPVYGPGRRRITPREAARLQGFPEWFSDLLMTQDDRESYKQMGNAVNVGAVQFALVGWVRHHRDALTDSGLADPLLDALVHAQVPAPPSRPGS